MPPQSLARLLPRRAHRPRLRVLRQLPRSAGLYPAAESASARARKARALREPRARAAQERRAEGGREKPALLARSGAARQQATPERQRTQRRSAGNRRRCVHQRRPPSRQTRRSRPLRRSRRSRPLRRSLCSQPLRRSRRSRPSPAAKSTPRTPAAKAARAATARLRTGQRVRHGSCGRGEVIEAADSNVPVRSPRPGVRKVRVSDLAPG